MKRKTTLKLRLVSLVVCSSVLLWGIYYNANFHIKADCDDDKFQEYLDKGVEHPLINYYTDICDVSQVPMIQWIAQISMITAFFGTLISFGLVIDSIGTRIEQTRLTQQFSEGVR